jgi:predicted acetyltransferase
MAEGSITHHVRVATERDAEALARVMAMSFTVPEDEALALVRQRPVEDYRVVERDGALVGGAFLHFMGQFFGGRRLPCLGVGSLAIKPEARGAGAAQALVDALIREGRDAGYALSALYPSTQSLYRRAGFEHGARWTRVKVPLSAIPRPETKAVTIEIAPGERLESLKALYFTAARCTDGHLDRSEAIWQWILHRPGREPQVYFFTEQGAPAGYVVLCNRRTEGFWYEIEILDHVVTSRASLAALYRLLAGHAALATGVELVCPPTGAFLLGLDEQHAEVTADWRMLLRVLDLEQAFVARPWPRGLRARLELDLTDQGLPEQQALWTIAFDGGVATVERGGSGVIKLDARALATLYGAAADPAALAAADRLKAPAGQMEILREVFRGPMATARDFF